MSVKSRHPGVTLPSDDEALSPALFDTLSERFEFVEEAGRGGMATVWLARRRSDGRRVALKVLRRNVAEALGAARFLREIGIASSVHSPSLMPLEESGEIHGMLYYVMPFAEGGSLRRRMDAQRQLAVDQAVHTARSLARGLTALHREGFVHRDIKPENVLLGAQNEVFLADFGIARALSAAATDVHTSTGIVLGTPTYMSPEQAGGEAADAHSDQYSLGCLLYEMLAGTPPFQGASAQAVIARHMSEAPPSLRVVRPAVSEAIESVVMRTLAKVPADRFEHMEAFVAALDAAEGGTPPAPMRRIAARKRRPAILAAAAIVVAVSVAAYWYPRRGAALDDERVIVFPFTALSAGHTSEGGQLAILMGAALEHTDATKWLDGSALVTERDRRDGPTLRPERALAIAREVRARFYLDGAVSRARDSITVQVVAHDAQDGTVLARRTESGGAATTPGDLALRALVGVMPKLTGLDKVVDVTGLLGHNAAAVDSWLRGEREYRRSNMEQALRFLAQAVRADSLLAPAAFRAAFAASWRHRPDSALTLVALALRHSEALSARQRTLAHALERFLAGRANEAIAALRDALGTDQETADAWMLAGEIQIHLLPDIGVDSLARRAIPAPTTWPLESFAQSAFRRAVALDPGFTPPMPHLASIAARRGDADALAHYTALLTAASPDSEQARRGTLIETCLRRGTRSVDWKAAVRTRSRRVFEVGAILQGATNTQARRCGIAALSSVLSADAGPGDEDWSSMFALHGMLIAQGQQAAALRLVDSAIVSGIPAAVALFVLDQAAGVDVGPRANGFLAQLDAAIDTRSAPSLWLLALAASHDRNATRLERIAARLDARARAPTAQRIDSLMARAAGAYLALARHDTTLAMSRFATLAPTAPHADVETTVMESLSPERLEYARLLLARHQFADAHRVASTFDQPSVFVHQLFLRPSLDVRLAAARGLDDSRLQQQARDHIAALESVAVP